MSTQLDDSSSKTSAMSAQALSIGQARSRSTQAGLAQCGKAKTVTDVGWITPMQVVAFPTTASHFCSSEYLGLKVATPNATKCLQVDIAECAMARVCNDCCTFVSDCTKAAALLRHCHYPFGDSKPPTRTRTRPTAATTSRRLSRSMEARFLHNDSPLP